MKKYAFPLAFTLALLVGLFAFAPQKVLAKGESHSAVSVGSAHTLVIKGDNSLWAWGTNDYGEIGDGTRNIYRFEQQADDEYEERVLAEDHNKLTPVRVMDDVMAVSAGYFHSTAIKTDGSLWAWGLNEEGQLGDGTTVDRGVPIKVMDNVADVSAMSHCTMAIKTDGSLWAWGSNRSGQLGDGTTTDRPTPVKIMDGVKSVSLGQGFAMVIKTDGSLWAWGVNGLETAHGRRGGWLGDGTVTDRPTPIKIMDNVLKVSAGAWHTLVIKTDGTLWAWGRNADGQLGNGSTDDSLAPVKVIGSHDLGAIWFMNGVTDVSAGAWHSMAIKTDGSLWGWGQNGNQQIIDGPGKRLMIPAKVMDDVVAAAIGSWHTIALKKDGSLWGWGNGPLGNGATGNHRSLIKIMDGVKLPGIKVIKPSP